ncbi:MAG TPA: SBBP repeat-containing protein [Candidatus Koribacter sp.]
MSRRSPLLVLVCGLLSSFCVSNLVAQSYGDLPLSFEPNRGQAPPVVKYVAHGNGYAFELTADAAVLRLGSQTLTLHVANGQQPQHVSPENLLPGKVNYFQGSDQARWLHELPTYARVRMSDVYPGVDLVYYGNHRELEYDFIVRPGASSSQLSLQAIGADEMKLTDDGGLRLTVGNRQLHWHAPVAYQEIAGQRRVVGASYEIRGSEIRFRLADYDHSRDLVIDPVLLYSTYLGGNGGDMGDVGNAIAVDSAGNAYVAGLAASTNFPTTGNAEQPATKGNDDAFVAKLNPDGTAFVYSTYLGGGGQDIAWGVAVDSAGEAYVTGQTGSGLNGTSSFPTTANAYQRTPNPATLNNSVFVAKLSSDGSDLLYSTLLTGSNDSSATGIAVDSVGNAYVITNTAGGFPVTSGAYQKTAGTDSCPYEQFAEGQAQVVTKLNVTGTTLLYSTYVGHGCDYGAGIAVNASGDAFITGSTEDSRYPVTSGAAQAKFGGVVDAFVTKLNATGSALLYSTFLGGSQADQANAIAVDSSGYAYVTGNTDGSFPTTSGSYEPTATSNGYSKGFVSKVSPLGKAWVYSTYVHSSGNVSFNGIAVDKNHYAYLTGYSDGAKYPATSNAEQATCHTSAGACMTQAVVTKLNATGSALIYSSYFGASDASNNYFPGNIGNAIAVDADGGFYITGRTSAGLKTTPGAVEASYQGNSNSTNAFVAKFNAAGATANATAVRIVTPFNGSAVISPVVFSAAATGSQIREMQIYVDGVKKDQVSGGVIVAALKVSSGKHRLTAQAVNTDGSLAKATVYVTIK